MVKLVIDSAADISEKEAQELGVKMLAMPITFENDEEFYDGVNLFPHEFYQKLEKCNELPKTSQITKYRFEEAFEEEVKAGNDVVAIVLSSKLSNTCNNAKQAGEKFPGRVFVVDSLNATAGQKLLVEYALRLIKEGKSAKEVYDAVEEKKSKVKVMAMIDTLKYLKKGGRINPLLAFAGELMGLKPMGEVIDGKVEVVGKCLGLKKAIVFLDKAIKEAGGIDFSMPFTTLYTGYDETKIDKYIQDNADLWECGVENVRKNCMGATIGTHLGPGVVGLAFFIK